MQLPKLYSERLENNVNDGGTLEEETGNIGLIWLSFVLISLRVKVYRKIPRIHIESIQCKIGTNFFKKKRANKIQEIKIICINEKIIEDYR